MIESVIAAVSASKARSKEVQVEKRRLIQSLSPSSASLDLLRNAIHLFGPDQLIADRRKAHPKVRLTRKVLSSCTLVSVAFDYVRKAEAMIETGSTVEKISKCIQIDKRSSLPHPKWTPYHDAVLINAIVKHGWLELDSSLHAMLKDGSVEWGPPFDHSRAVPKAVNVPRVPPAMVEAVAERACEFLNDNKQLLNGSKTLQEVSLIRAYWLEKHRPPGKGDSLADTFHEENYVINREALLQEETGENAELAELPTKKEMLKRAKTILTRATLSPGASPEEDQPRNDHSLTVLDQSNPCNVFLAQLVRGMLKAPVGGELYKLLTAKTVAEARARKSDMEMFADSADGPQSTLLDQQRKDLQNIMEQIDMAKRTMHKSVRLGKNILRAIIGEDLVVSKNPNEPLVPSMTPRLKVAPVKGKQSKLKPTKARKIDKKITAAEAAIADARKMIDSKQKPASTVDLTEVETTILQTASNFGIPQFTSDWRGDYFNMSSLESTLTRFTWSDFGRRLVDTAKERLQDAAAKRDKANKDYESLEFKPNISSDKRDSIERISYFAEATYEACEVAKGQAEDYAGEPETLAKKTIMTLSKAAKQAETILSDNSAGSPLYNWLSEEILVWGKHLELLGEDGTVLALTAQDFVTELNEAERSSVQAVAAFDTTGCAQLVTQIALVSRLGALLRRYRSDPDGLHALVAQASLDKSWPERPAWWSAETAEFDILFLKRLCESGFGELLLLTKTNHGILGSVSGLLVARCCGFAFPSLTFLTWQQARVSYKAGGMYKGPLSLRAMSLVTEMHALDCGDDEKAVSTALEGVAASVLTEDNHMTPQASKKARVSVS